MASAPQFFGADLTASNFRFSSTAYFLLGSNGGTVIPVTTEARAQLVLRAAGTISRFSANVITNSSAASVTATLRNQSGNLTSALAIGTATGQFQDLSHTDSVAAGDKLDGAPTGGTSLANFTISVIGVEWAPSSGQSQFCTSQNASSFFSASTSYYQAPAGLFSAGGTTEASAQAKAGLAATASNLAMFVASNANANAMTFAFRDGGVTGSQSISIAAAATGYQEDLSHTDSVASGDLVNTILTTGSGAVSLSSSFTGILFSPSDTLYDLNSNTGTTVILSNSADNYLPIIGAFAGAVTEASEQIKYPFAETFRGLRIYVGANANANFSLRTRIGGIDGAQSVTLNGTGYLEDVSHTDSCAASDLLNLRVAHGSGTGPSVFTTGLTGGLSTTNANLTAVSGTGTAAAMAPKIEIALTAVATSGAVNPVSTPTSANVPAPAIVASGAAAPLGLRIDSNVSLAATAAGSAVAGLSGGAAFTLGGVAAAASIVAVIPKAEPFAVFPVLGLMRNTAVPAVADMSNEAVALIMPLPPSGPAPASVAFHLVGVSAGSRASTISPFRNVNVNLAAASAAAKAEAVVAA